MSAQFTYYNNYTNVNSALFSIDPYTSGYLDLQVTQNLLYGFGSAVNGRNIRVQKNNIKVTNLQFKQQVATTVSAVLNLYWDLVEFWEDVARPAARIVGRAEQLLDNNRKQARGRHAGAHRSHARGGSGLCQPAGFAGLADQSAAAGNGSEERHQPQRNRATAR